MTPAGARRGGYAAALAARAHARLEALTALPWFAPTGMVAPPEGTPTDSWSRGRPPQAAKSAGSIRSRDSATANVSTSAAIRSRSRRSSVWRITDWSWSSSMS